MSGVWGWFGGQSAQKRKDAPKNAILGLRSQLEMLQKRERHLQNQMDEQDQIARKNVSTNKNGTCQLWARDDSRDTQVTFKRDPLLTYYL
jgi:hypothetical protein